MRVTSIVRLVIEGKLALREDRALVMPVEPASTLMKRGSLVAPHAALESILKAWGRQMSLNAWTVLWANLLLRLVTHAFRVLREHAAPIRE